MGSRSLYNTEDWSQLTDNESLVDESRLDGLGQFKGPLVWEHMFGRKIEVRGCEMKCEECDKTNVENCALCDRILCSAHIEHECEDDDD